MASRPVSGFRSEFIARTREARQRRDLTQTEMAELLQIDQGTYKNYETTRPLPHQLVVPFCLAVGVDVSWLYTGRLVKTPKPKIKRLRRAG